MQSRKIIRSFTTPDFAQRISEVHGESGARWLSQLPDLIRWCEREWNLRAVQPIHPLAYNFVATAQMDGCPAALKLGVPHDELWREMAAMERYDGRGAARLLQCDRDRGALLLELVQPGNTLESVESDEEAARICASVIRTLCRPLPERREFLPVAEWARGMQRLRATFDGGGGGAGPFPLRTVEMAESLFRNLLETSGEKLLLHGDLHQGNILAEGDGADRRWLAIDPKGVAGELAYEAGAFIRNPLPELLARPDCKALLTRRIEVFAEELGVDPERIRAWAAAQAALSGWWSYEDHGRGWEPAFTLAQMLGR